MNEWVTGKLQDIDERTIRIEERLLALPDKLAAQKASCSERMGAIEGEIRDVRSKRTLTAAKLHSIGVVVAALLGTLGGWLVSR